MAKWKCLNCGETKGVTNGECKKCGPVQTDPQDKEAYKEAGVKYSIETQEKDTQE